MKLFAGLAAVSDPEPGPPTAADTLRDHVAVQGEKFHQLMASLRTAAQ